MWPFTMTNFNYDFTLQVNVIVAIVLKFGSIVCFSLALDNYQNLSANGSYLIYAMYCCVAPSALLVPVYSYDHIRCMPKNFVFNNATAQDLSHYSLLFVLIPLVFTIIIPKTYTGFLCYYCARR